MRNILAFIARVRMAYLRSRMYSILHRVDELGHKQFSSLQAMRDGSIDAAMSAELDKYWTMVSRDPEMWAILQHYRVTREEIDELRGVFQRCGISSAEGMSLPFPIEYAAHLLRTDSTDENEQCWLHHCVRNVTEGFANEGQRRRYAEIFGKENIRAFESNQRAE